MPQVPVGLIIEEKWGKITYAFGMAHMCFQNTA